MPKLPKCPRLNRPGWLHIKPLSLYSVHTMGWIHVQCEFVYPTIYRIYIMDEISENNSRDMMPLRFISEVHCGEKNHVYSYSEWMGKTGSDFLNFPPWGQKYRLDSFCFILCKSFLARKAIILHDMRHFNWDEKVCKMIPSFLRKDKKLVILFHRFWIMQETAKKIAKKTVTKIISKEENFLSLSPFQLMHQKCFYLFTCGGGNIRWVILFQEKNKREKSCSEMCGSSLIKPDSAGACKAISFLFSGCTV